MNAKRLFAAMTAAAMIVGATACGNGGAASSGAASSGGTAPSASSDPAPEKKTFKVWATGSDNVQQMLEILVDDFNTNSEYAGTYQAELSYMLSGTGAASLVDSLAAAYQTGQTNTDYDVLEMGGDNWSKLLSYVGEDAFVELDKSKIPNAATVTAEIANGTSRIQPYRGTTVVLAYNGDTVTDVPKTMDELLQWIKDHPGRFTYNTPGTGGAADGFIRTLTYNFMPEEAAYSGDPKWVEQWDQGFEILKEIHPYMYSSGGTIIYPNKNQGALDLLANGEIDMCPMWADMVLSQRAAGTVPSNVKITTITPPFTGDAVGWTIPTIGSNVDGAYAWMNYMLSDEVQRMLVEKMAAIPLVDMSGMDMTGYEDLLGLDVSNFRTLSIGDLGVTYNEKWDNEIAILS